MICRKYRIIFGKLTFRQFSLLFFIENNSFFRESLLNVSFIKTTVSVEGVLQLSLHFIMIINIHVRYQIQDKKYWGDC